MSSQPAYSTNVAALHFLTLFLHCTADNWLLCAAGKEDQAGVRVHLIDFGRSLSARHHGTGSPPLYDSSEADVGAQQLEAMQGLYEGMSCEPSPQQCRPVQYRGEVAVKSYQCTEMRREEAWSYQVRTMQVSNTVLVC